MNNKGKFTLAAAVQIYKRRKRAAHLWIVSYFSSAFWALLGCLLQAKIAK